MDASMSEPCAIARSLGVLGERWTFLIVREALWGASRFGEFRDALGVAPDVLSARLARLVDAGVMEKVPYQEPGSRQRWAYELTPAGRDLQVVLGAMQGWGDRHIPRPEGPSVERRTVDGGRPVHVGFVDDAGREVAAAEVETIRRVATPARRVRP
jgi:DNA-binding HxlR family transcriptional regulator